jgi:hypothetical protein
MQLFKKEEKQDIIIARAWPLWCEKIQKFGYPELSQDNLKVIVNCVLESVSSAGAMLLLLLSII